MGVGMMELGIIALVLVLFVVAIIVGVVLLVRAVRSTDAGHAGGNGGIDGSRRGGALSILEERFARGEIDDEEFRARRRALREDG